SSPPSQHSGPHAPLRRHLTHFAYSSGVRCPAGQSRSHLQLLLYLIEEAPVGTLGDNLLRTALDHADLMQARAVDAPGVSRIVLPPPAVGDLLQRLEGVLIAGRDPPVHKKPGSSFRLAATDVRCLQDGTEHSLCGYWMLLDELPVRDHHAAEV